jgi:serine/threonine kinase 16
VISINSRKFVVERLVGEGGFSYVYLVRDPYTSEQYAVKKTLCQTEESLEAARKEVQVMKNTRHNNVLQLLDSEVRASKKTADASEVLVLLPFYKKGTLYDLLLFYRQANKHLTETEILKIFVAVCSGLKEFHSKQLAHNDIKPGNILLSEENNPVLMDFGSVSQSRYMIMSRKEALQLQEFADSHCTPSYKAPELFDVGSDALIDERTDVWSLGCTLYAMAFYQSPFDVENENASISLAVKSGRIQWPDDAERLYSKEFRQLISSMITPIQSRPYIDDVITATKALLAK